MTIVIRTRIKRLQVALTMQIASFVFSGDLSPAGTTKIFAAVLEPELLFYTSDVSCITDVIVSEFFALTPKGT